MTFEYAATGVTHPDSSLEALLAVLLIGLGAEPVALMGCGLKAVGEFAVCVGVEVAVGVERCAD